MKISIINYDNDSKEADVMFENDNQILLTYCPFLKDNNHLKGLKIYAFLPTNQMLTNENESITKKSGFYSYELIGKIIKIDDNILVLSVFGIEIFLDEFPKDIKVGNNIKFEVVRLDCICS